MSDVIAREVAEQEFDRFADEMDLDVDESKMDEEERSSFIKIKEKLLKAMQRGSLIINSDGEAVYTPIKEDDPQPITFHERTGATLMATDTKKKNQQAAKLYAMMADMTKQPPVRFSKMKGTDIKICEGIFTLLMD